MRKLFYVMFLGTIVAIVESVSRRAAVDKVRDMGYNADTAHTMRGDL